jgi:hypothetical protein
LQSLENAQNAERISILREPVPQAGGTPGADDEARRATGAGGGARDRQGLDSIRRKVAKKGKKGLQPT